MSEELRLKRLVRDAIYKNEQHQLVIPIKRGADPAATLIKLLRELRPPEASP
jgi:hypothetical protein